MGEKRRLMVRLTAACICVVLTSLAVAGCTGLDGEREADVLTPTPDDVRTETVIGLIPSNTMPLFSGLALLAERSGLPYNLELMEVVSDDAGVQAVVSGQADLMFLMRRPWPDEPLVLYELFHTPTAIFVNAEAGITNLSRAQAAAVFCGEITNWAQLGGPDLAITVFIQQEDDTNTVVMHEHVLEDRDFVSSAQVVYSDQKVLAVIGGLPGAIGYTAWASTLFYKHDVPGEYPPLVSLDGLTPEDAGYPMWSSAGLVFRPERQAALQPLLDWIVGFVQSDIGRALSEQYGLHLSH